MAVALAAHLRTFPAVEVTAPWCDLDGEPRTAGLVFTSRECGPVIRKHYNGCIRKPAVKAAGMEPSRHTGVHQLRHNHASVLLHTAVSIRVVADYLDHADPGFTLRVYNHLMPDTEDRARSAVDAALGPRADSVRTSEVTP